MYNPARTTSSRIKPHAIPGEISTSRVRTRYVDQIIIPSLRPVFFSTVIILTHIAIKSFDLVVVLTGGGPGYASDLPATFMYSYAFTRGQLAMGAASAMMMFCMVMAIIVPYLYSELRRRAYA